MTKEVKTIDKTETPVPPINEQLVKMFSQMERQGIGFDTTTGINTKNSFTSYSRPLKKYDTDTVSTWLEQPGKYAKELRDLSIFLLHSNTLYYRVVHYMSSMAEIHPVLVPTEIKGSPKQMQDNYLKAAQLLDVLNLPHEFVKIFTTLFSEAVFYGLECQADDSFYIKKLNPDYCQVTSVNDGSYCFHFDLTFFDSDKSWALLESYEAILPIFKSAYTQYKKDKTLQWVEIPAENSICLRIAEGSEYSVPPFVSAFGDFCNIEDYKNLNKISTEQSNYQLLGLEMETNSKSDKPNDFKVSADVVMSFYNMIAAGMPSGVGTFITPVKANPIKFDKRVGEIDQVANATEALYQSLGLSSVLFAGATNAGTLKYSTRVDEAMLFAIYRQIERWINRKLKFENLNFKVTLLDITAFNRNDVQDELLKMAQSSVPVKAHLAAASGLSPLDMAMTHYLETNILEFENNWIPLSSSHTQSSSDGEAGREAEDVTDLSDSGAATRDTDANANREGAL